MNKRLLSAFLFFFGILILSSNVQALAFCDEASLHAQGTPCFIGNAEASNGNGGGQVTPSTPKSDASTDTLVQLVSEIPFVTGFALERRSLPSSCKDPAMLAVLEKYMNANGLYKRGFTRSMVVGLMAAESGCNQNIARGQGIMQVVTCAKDHCGLDENIRRGTKELAGNFDNRFAIANNKQVAIALAYFEYNRGPSTAALAAKKFSQGVPFRKAMAEACYYYFDRGAYGGCGGFGREACCNTPGLGSGYPSRIAAFVLAAKNSGMDSRVA